MVKSKQQRRKIADPEKVAAHSVRAQNGPKTKPTKPVVPDWAIYCLLGFAVLSVYSSVRRYPFINYDDDTYITSNPHVQAGLSWATIRWSMTTMEAANWHPLTWLSHALDCELFGMNAGWHHLTNVLIHLANVILLFVLLRKATGAPGRSLVVAGLFGLHPFNVGSVAWIAERKNVLSTLFLLLTLGAYGWYARKPELKRYLLIIVLFALGLTVKPMMVTLPFALLLLDCWPLQRLAGWSQLSEPSPVPRVSAPRLVVEKLPLLALSVASSLMTLTAQKVEVQVAAISYTARVANAIYSYILYIWKTCWPAGFSIYYPHPFTNPSVPPGPGVWSIVALGMLLLIVATVAAWWQRRSRPYLLTGWLWYLGTLVPVIGFVQVGSQGMADRYAYVPLLGIFVIIAWGGNEFAARLGLNLAWRQRLAAAVLLALAILSFHEVEYWKTSLDLWTHARAVTENNYYADLHIGDLLAAQGKSEALESYREAVHIAPWYVEGQFALAMSLQYHGLLQEAAEHYELFVGRSGDPQELSFAYINLSMIFGELAEFDRVHDAFQRALRSDPQVVTDMIESVTQATRTNPSDGASFCLGLLLEQSGQLSAARDAYTQALDLNPQQREAQRGLARLDASGAQSRTTDRPGS
jgi:hypothetical protein